MKDNSEEEILEIRVLPPKVCKHYLQGNCKFGSECTKAHPKNLSPRVNPKTDHKVSTKVGAACRRCIERHLVCDKASRPREDDPCSECRWFAGENGHCVLAAKISRDDQMFKQMAASKTFTLPKFKPRDAPINESRKTVVKDKDGNPVVKVPQPMPPSNVRADWEGPTRDEVLNIPDMLPADVRENPWAYCRNNGKTRKQSRISVLARKCVAALEDERPAGKNGALSEQGDDNDEENEDELDGSEFEFHSE